MGRLTLNVLLSFAQFEREVTAERIRDKVSASKKKGMWMGGTVPLGYDNIDKKLIINEDEAKIVREIFYCYQNNTSIIGTCHQINTQGYRTKLRSGVKEGGRKFSPGHINYILKNQLYIGNVTHKNKIYKGGHKSIIDQEPWNKTQNKIKENKIARISGKNFKAPGLLCGILKTIDDQKLYPTHCNKQGKRYHYYISKPTDPNLPSLRYSADQIDDAIRNYLIIWLNDITNHDQDISDINERIRSVLSDQLKSNSIQEQKLAIHFLLREVVISETKISMTIDKNFRATHTPDWITLDIKIIIEPKRKNKKLVIPNGNRVIQKPDQKLIELIAKAHIWAKELQSGKYATMTDLAKKHNMNKADLGKQLRLAYLSPDIITSILEGRQPHTLKATHLRKLTNLPSCWEEQRKLLHFA